MIKDDLIEILCENGTLNPREVHNHITFEQLGLDSLDTVEIVMEIEHLYDINLDDISAKELQEHTLQSLCNIVEAKVLETKNG